MSVIIIQLWDLLLVSVFYLFCICICMYICICNLYLYCRKKFKNNFGISTNYLCLAVCHYYSADTSTRWFCMESHWRKAPSSALHRTLLLLTVSPHLHLGAQFLFWEIFTKVWQATNIWDLPQDHPKIIWPGKRIWLLITAYSSQTSLKMMMLKMMMPVRKF